MKLDLACYSIYTLCCDFIFWKSEWMTKCINNTKATSTISFIKSLKPCWSSPHYIFTAPLYATTSTTNTTTIIIPTATLYIHCHIITQRSTKIHRRIPCCRVCAELLEARRNANKYRQIYPRAFLLHVHFDATATARIHMYSLPSRSVGCSKFIDSLLCFVYVFVFLASYAMANILDYVS